MEQIITVRYFATTNLKSPFVAVFGHWPDRAALVRNSLINGVQLGSRNAISCEIEHMETNPHRHMFMYWPSIRSMLWTHKSPDLEHAYEALVNNIRIKSRDIKSLAKIREQKRQRKLIANLITAETIAKYKQNTEPSMSKIINEYEFEYTLDKVNQVMHSFTNLANSLPYKELSI